MSAEVPHIYWSELVILCYFLIPKLDRGGVLFLFFVEKNPSDSREEKTDESEQLVQTSSDVVCDDGGADASCLTVCARLTVRRPVLH